MRKTIALLAILLTLPLISSAQMLDADTSVEVSTSTESTEEDLETSTTTDASGALDLDADLEVNALGIPVTASAQVMSEGDLEVYEENLKIQDENVAEIRADEEVAVEYFHEGHLFGLFPVKVKSMTKVETDEDGRVRVVTRMPWWNVFVAGTGRVAAAIDDELEGALSAGADASARARAIEVITRAHANVSVNR